MPDFAALHDPAWQRLGVALIHFIWQGLLIAALYELWVVLFEVRRAQSRYLGGLAALILMTLCPVVTWCVVDVRHDLLASPTGQSASAASRLVAGLAPLGQQWISSFVAAWLLGVTLFGARVAAGVLGVCWIMRRGTEVPEAWRTRISELCRALGLARVPQCIITTEVHEALAAGFFRPFVIVPSAWLLELPPQVLEAVLAHELAHIRRWDLWVNLAQRLIEALLFYHPAVWWLSQSIRADREMCCDDLAVSVTKQHVHYASALETVARRGLRPQLSSLAIGIGGPHMALLERVRNVLGIGATARGAVWGPVALLVVAVTLALWMTSGRGPIPAEAADRDLSARDELGPDGYYETARGPEDRPPGRWAPPPRRGPPPDDGPPPRDGAPPPRDGQRRGPPPDGPRPDSHRRPPPDRNADDRPPTSREEELLRTVRDLRDEVLELRRDVREIRDRRPPPLPPPLRDLLDALPRDEYGRPTWAPQGAPPKSPKAEPSKEAPPAEAKQAE